MKEEIRKALETYDKYAKIYADYTSQKSFQFQLNQFITSIQKNAKILDAGCGAGRDVAYLLEENKDVIGIDLSKGLLEEAKKRCPSGKFEQMDFLKTSFDKETFDGIWCMASLSDIPKEKTKDALSEFYRILKNNGLIFIAVKVGEGEKIIKKKKYEDSPRFYSFFTRPELEHLLISSSFELVSSTIADDLGTEWLEIFARKSPLPQMTNQ